MAYTLQTYQNLDILHQTQDILNNLSLAINGGANGNIISCAMVTFDSTVAVELAGIPEDVKTCIVALEADSTTTDMSICAHFTESGDAPTATSGMPLGNAGVYQISTPQNIAGFKIIGLEAGKTNRLQISYYS